MRRHLAFDDMAAFTSIAAEIEVTAAIEGGVGPVRLGTPARRADGKMLVVHEFADVDLDWICAYANDPRLTVEGEEA